MATFSGPEVVVSNLSAEELYNKLSDLNNLKEIPMVWNGGMSFHGAVLGIILSTLLFCKKNNENIFYFLDLVALSAPIGIFLGRIANFLNSELYGRETDILWSVNFIKIDDLNRHPSQIYEAIFEGLILFILMKMLYKKFSTKSGLISSLFIIFYSIFRFIIEYTREPDVHLGFVFLNMSMGQVISLISLIVGIIFIYINYDFKKQ